jgi:hypothetical protein
MERRRIVDRTKVQHFKGGAEHLLVCQADPDDLDRSILFLENAGAGANQGRAQGILPNGSTSHLGDNRRCLQEIQSEDGQQQRPPALPT